GIDVLPPDINESNRDFTVSGQSIRFGLVAIKNVGESAIESMIAIREEGGRFTSLFDFCNRVDLRRVNKRTMESLIKSGAFDTMGLRRSQLMEVLDKAMLMGASHQKTKKQVRIFEALGAAGEDTALGILPDIPEWDEHILLKNEKETIGFYVTGHPLAKYEAKIRKHTALTTKVLGDLDDGKEVTICGIITDIRPALTKKGDKMAYLRIEDLDGSVEIIVFPDLYKASSELLAVERLVIITGVINKNDAGSKIKGGRIQDLLTAPGNMQTQMDIRLHSLGLTAEDIKNLRGILEGHKGKCPVFLHLITNQKEYVVALDNNLRITPSDQLTASIEDRFGKHTVVFN
ncbi:MAG: OB-fold nucleic acid binding domain-containing protein, partial [Nitrospirota bacterium]|nr:OB-fold nucleic acid binding domain-containing protein [Nitrospirota bacterium]